jgi:glycerate dehydrogenase
MSATTPPPDPPPAFSSRPRIVILDSFAADQGETQSFWQGLAALGELTLFPRTDPAQRIERAAGALALLTNKVIIDAELVAALPELRYVGVLATGTNIIDLEAARARGVAVTNVPGYATRSVAELVFAMILHFTLDVAGHDAAVKNGAWARSPDFCFFQRPLHELAGKTLVVIGAGHIGGAVARIGEAFGMTVVRAAVPGSSSPGRTPLEQALPLADVVTLHCPLTDATRGLVNQAFLRALKPEAILINTGRGPLIDEAALMAALGEGRLSGVGLDVLSQEPPPADHPLLDRAAPWAARLAVTPHIGWGTIEARRRLARMVALNLEAFLTGQRLHRVV